MKIGLGLYRHMLTPENFRFARQAGATFTNRSPFCDARSTSIAYCKN